jgi:hypothetical protein
MLSLSLVVDHGEAIRAAQSHGSGDHSLYSSALSHIQQNTVRRTGAIRPMHCSLRRSMRYRASMEIPSTRTLSNVRITRSMSRVPVVVCLHRPLAALRRSRYALCRNWLNRYLNLRRAQALKKFTSGGGGSGGGGSQTQLISMAMGEASKLFDQHGGSGSGGKQDAVNGAAMTVTKLLVQSKLSGMTGGGNSGGLGGLASLVRCWVRFEFLMLILRPTHV